MMKPAALVLILVLASCDASGNGGETSLPTGATIAVVKGDSLFVASLGGDGSAAAVRVGDGQFDRAVTFAGGSNDLDSNESVSFSVLEPAIADRRIVTVQAADPSQPTALGAPDRGVFTTTIAPSGQPYGLAFHNSGPCDGWALVSLDLGAAPTALCVDTIRREDEVPQNLWVDENGDAVIIPFHGPDPIFGLTPHDIVVYRDGEPTVYPSVTPASHDGVYHDPTQTAFVADVRSGAVFALRPGTTSAEEVLPAEEDGYTGVKGRRLFLLGDLLVTYQHRADRPTAVHLINAQTGAHSTFDLPGSYVQADENDGYVMFRPYASVREPTTPETVELIGFCADGLEVGATLPPLDRYQVTLPPFARRTAAFEHSATCR